jgi:hypothetical protein
MDPTASLILTLWWREKKQIAAADSSVLLDLSNV